MVHGGTNFGFYNGANTGSEESDYKPDLTSYDYVGQFHIITCYCKSLTIFQSNIVFVCHFRMLPLRSLVT